MIDGKPYRLDSLVVKKTGSAGRLPVALITHGTALSKAEIRSEDTDKFAPRARDLALRGWLAVVVIRRGYGRSDGAVPQESCKRPRVKEGIDAAADDLQAVMDVMKERPDVDPSRIIAIGDSTGGATVVGLGARNPPGLVGVVSVSGGMRLECANWQDKLIDAYGAYGSTSRVPDLWIYAKNDSYFGPELTNRLRAALVGGGGNVKLEELDPFMKEGHYLFLQGGMQWLRELDDFLQNHKLPTWSYTDVSALQRHLALRFGGQQVAVAYLTAPVPKAMAFSTHARLAYYQYDGDIPLATIRNLALARCKEARNSDCSIVMENDRWVGPQ
ncbi:dienelactone hydrolase [Mesorhizobium sp. 113-1-2]|nr:dienelactone hydrolase [Mesorhizobium sp. 113-1-2]